MRCSVNPVVQKTGSTSVCGLQENENVENWKNTEWKAVVIEVDFGTSLKQ